MKKATAFNKSFFQLSLLFLAFFVFQPVFAEKQIKIKDAQVKGTVLTLEHDSFSDIKFKKRIYDNPPRLVFDILDAELGNRTIKHDLPKKYGVSQSRIAQFDDTTVRVVIEGDSISVLEKVRIENIGQNLYFKFVVKNVKIQDLSFDEGDFRISANSSLVPRTILLDNPERLVVDIIGAELKSNLQAKKFSNGDEKIRVSQFDDSIVRVVFSGRNSHKREVRISNNEKQVLVLGKDRADNEKDEVKDDLSLKLIKNKKDETVYVIESSEKLEYKFLKLHNPERLVIDLIDIKYDESFVVDDLPETDHVSDVRVGLATLGRPVTRIVFDQKFTNLLEEFKEANNRKTIYIRMLGLDNSKVKGGNDIQPAKKSKGTIVVLDAGHGGYDHGAIYGGYNEKDIVLSITNKVKEYLQKAGIEVYMTRTEDRFISLAERVEVSNAVGPKIFVSIHVNALITNPNMSGLQTYYYSQNGYKLGSVIHKQLLKDIKMDDGRLRKAQFWVTKYTKAPSVLLELGFMTNVKERKKLVRDSYQSDLAKSITRGIIDYLE